MKHSSALFWASDKATDTQHEDVLTPYSPAKHKFSILSGTVLLSKKITMLS